MNFVIQQVKQTLKKIKAPKIKAPKIKAQNIKAHTEQQEPKYSIVCEKQPILVKSWVIINLINQYMIQIS